MKSLEIPCVGYSIAADLYESTSDQILLVLPGYSSNKKNQKELVEALIELTGTSALVIDYTGHGKSPFDLPELTPAQNFLEVITAFDWIKENYPNKIINVMGNSYGGFLAAQLIKYRAFNKLVLRVPAIYSPQDFYTKWKNIDREDAAENLRRDVEALANHPLFGSASNFKGKTFVVVHGKDELVPKETTDAYIKAFNADMYLAEGFSHRFGDNLHDPDKVSAYQEAIAEWLKS